jgi:hypothetical protein
MEPGGVREKGDGMVQPRLTSSWGSQKNSRKSMNLRSARKIYGAKEVAGKVGDVYEYMTCSLKQLRQTQWSLVLGPLLVPRCPLLVVSWDADERRSSQIIISRPFASLTRAAEKPKKEQIVGRRWTGLQD